MGVPKFFRYISERYPCLSELVRENQIPEFDNLYLDMNGIIHNCSHPDDGNVHFRITEEQIFKAIFHYIDTLFRMIQPQKLFFMAVDGVAPRAKMNQQRGRRFRSAKEAEVLEAKAKQKGEKLPTDDRFDSNCITPGTEFMVRLQEALRYFVKVKISTSPLWKNCRVILSGHETPGEGEHKIMEYIRYLKSSPEYDPNTRHCLYGLDADLIILGLCTHELHFSLLREEVKYGKTAKKAASVDETRFFLLHLNLLKEYLELEFISIKDKMPFDFDIEKIIDDWIFMGFLVGNDFIPNLPNLHINSNALETLCQVYMKTIVNLDGYINEQGKLNLKRFEKFMENLCDVDKELFEEHYSDLKYFAAKRGNAFDETFDSPMEIGDNDLDDLIKQTEEMYVDDIDDDDEDATFEKEFRLHKINYYKEKLKYAAVTDEVLAEQAECYVRALQWILLYYYRGVKSWCWYYPHHYAPFISDIKNFSHIELNYEMGKPFLPFEQLLAVLPAASRKLLPSAYQDLMTNPKSDVIDYYPENFETDLNGKKQEWEAVVLIPFIEENKLINAMKPCWEHLSEEEKHRNTHGPMYQYDYSEVNTGPVDSVNVSLPSIPNIYCTEKKVSRSDIEVSENNLNLGPSKGALRDVLFPGFPTMKFLNYTGKLKSIRVKVFEQPSRNSTLVLCLKSDISEKDNELLDIAEELMGKEVFVGWPHLRESKVVGISTSDQKVTRSGLEPNDKNRFAMESKAVILHHAERMGIDLGPIKYLVHVNVMTGRDYVYGAQGKMTLNKSYSSIIMPYAYQAIVKDIRVHNPSFVQFTNATEVFTKGSNIYLMSTPYYGSEGVVMDSSIIKTCGRIKIAINAFPEPDFEESKDIHYDLERNYHYSYNAANEADMDPRLFNRITGTIYVIAGHKSSTVPEGVKKHNIGLQLKMIKANEEVIGYTRKRDNDWMYSNKTIAILEQYAEKFPRVIDFLIYHGRPNKDLYFESEIFPNFEKDPENNLNNLLNWLKSLPCYKSERRTAGNISIELEALPSLVKAVDKLQDEPFKRVMMQVKPHLIYKPNLSMTSNNPDREAYYKIFHRVVVVKDTYVVPVGLKGTIIAVNHVTDPNPVRQECKNLVDIYCEILFDSEFPHGYSIEGVEGNRVYKVPTVALINITYGQKKFSANPKQENPKFLNAPPVNAWLKPLWDKDQNRKRNNDNGERKRENVALRVNRKENMQIKDGANNRKGSAKKEKMQPQEEPSLKESEAELKRLLGIGSMENNESNANPIPSTSTSSSNLIPVKLEDLFKSSQIKGPPTMDLPKPPLNWTMGKPKKNGQNLNGNHSQNNYNRGHNSHKRQDVIQTAFPMQQSQQYYGFPREQGNFQRPPFRQHFPPPHRQQNYYKSQNQFQNYQSNQPNPNRPRGPQKLSYDGGSQVGHGAFIPLQAARQITKRKNSQVTEKSERVESKEDTPSSQQNIESRQKDQITKVQKNVVNKNHTPSKSSAPPVIKSRIGAKFNVTKD